MWIEGRGKGYFKWPLLRFKRLDLYILKYGIGSGIAWHTDNVRGFKHHRINITLNSNFEGGEPYKFNPERKLLPRIYYIRPDIEHHGVLKVLKGTRYVLSIGWLTCK